MKATDLIGKAVEYVLKTPKTARQVRTWLNKKTDDKDVADEVIKYLQDRNYINDREYAAAFVQCKKIKLGAGMIKNKLRVKGVSTDIIEHAMVEVDDQRDLAIMRVEKYMQNKEKTAEIKSKLFRYLMGKGFDFETAGGAVNEYWNRH